MRLPLLLITTALSIFPDWNLAAQTNAAAPAKITPSAEDPNKDARLAWWREAKFGMFIHWGVYSSFGGEWKGQKVEGYAEHLQRIMKINRAEYLDSVV